MMRPARIPAASALLATLLLAPPVFAGPVAEVINTGTKLIFRPLVEHDQIVFTVTGPCNFVQQDVIRDGEAVFALSSETIDGVYRAELVVIPKIDSGIIEVLKRARETGDNGPVNELCREGQLPGAPSTQLDGFHVDRGKIVYDPKETDAKVGREGGELDFDALLATSSGPAEKDQVIPDDLIVDGSLCVGFDCVNNENFGFDTIRLKENNLRIKFDDTSTLSGFPNRDWQLTANDSASGGQSKLSIDDVTSGRTVFTVEGNAPSNSLYVDDGARIGRRTASPVTEIHLVDGDTPTVRLEQDGSSGFAPQVWDVAGNETNFFVRDVTGGSALPLRIRPGAPSSSLLIDDDGNVGIGTASPDVDLDIDRGASQPANFRVTGDSAGYDLQDLNGGANQKVAQQFVDANRWRLRGLNDALAAETVAGISLDLADGDVGINCNNSADHDLVVGSGGSCTATPRSFVDAGSTSFSTSSSRSYKENLTPVQLPGILDKISKVQVYNYDFIGGPKDRLGLMAEDFHQIFGRGSDKVLSGQELEMAMWLAIQELTQKVARLEGELASAAASSQSAP